MSAAPDNADAETVRRALNANVLLIREDGSKAGVLVDAEAALDRLLAAVSVSSADAPAPLSDPVTDAKKSDLGRMAAQVGAGSLSGGAAPDNAAADARERIRLAAALKNNDSAQTLAFVAIRDGEAWNDRRLPEVGRALTQALVEIDTLVQARDRLTENVQAANTRSRKLADKTVAAEAALAAAERENALVKAALAEECAECGHIDWRSDGYLEPFIERAESAERRVEALTAALTRGAGTFDATEAALLVVGNTALALVCQIAAEDARAALVGSQGDTADTETT